MYLRYDNEIYIFSSQTWPFENGGADEGLWFLRNKELDMTFLNFFRVIAKVDIDLEN